MQLLSIVLIGEKFKAASFQLGQGFWQFGAIRWCTLWLVLAGCGGGQPVLPPPTPTLVATPDWSAQLPTQPTDEAAVTALILAERQAAIDQDLALLSQLWADEARIVDGRGNTDPADDYIWQGRAAILDRYVVAVFPFALPPLPSLDATATLTITGDQAMVQNGHDYWQFSKMKQRWWLTELRYRYQSE